jgi:hypothetical protein
MRSVLIACSCAVLSILSGCGGSDASAPPPVGNDPPVVTPPPPPPPPVEGVATPSSVAVVTATNA